MFQSIDTNPRFTVALTAFYQEILKEAQGERPYERPAEEEAALDWLIAIIDGHIAEQVSLALRQVRDRKRQCLTSNRAGIRCPDSLISTPLLTLPASGERLLSDELTFFR